MKTLSVLCLIPLLASCATAPEVPLDDFYEKVIEVPGSSKETLYGAANAWFVEVFNSAESVIEFQDKEAGRVMGKYVFKAHDWNWHYRTIVSIDVRDGAIRVKFYDPSWWTDPFGGTAHWTPVSSFKPGTRHHHMSKYISPEWYGMVASLESRLKESDDW